MYYLQPKCLRVAKRRAFTHKSFISPLALVPFLAAFLMADESNISDVVVIEKKTINTNVPTKVRKDAAILKKQQVANVRDLVKYDPGISVVEQGRGNSSGYSIRGVDKDRVSVRVDGLEQLQNFKPNMGMFAGALTSGAKNEIEFENVKEMEISRGSSSVSSGSGALGGAVGFSTKEIDDFLLDGKAWGGGLKSSYASKDGQWMKNAYAAYKHEYFDVFFNYTHRSGHELRGHHSSKRPDETVKLEVKVPDPDKPGEYKSSKEYKEFVISHKNATGAAFRSTPDPMKYKSSSMLLKINLNLNEHQLGAAAEINKATYKIRDMLQAQFWGSAKKPSFDRYGSPQADQVSPLHDSAYGKLWSYETGNPSDLSHARFFDEISKKRRLGLHYKYEPEQGFIDLLKLRYDSQVISLYQRKRDLHCGIFPHFDKNCLPTNTKYGEDIAFNRYWDTKYTESSKSTNLALKKSFEIRENYASLKLDLGGMNGKATFTDFTDKFATHNFRASNNQKHSELERDAQGRPKDKDSTPPKVPIKLIEESDKENGTYEFWLFHSPNRTDLPPIYTKRRHIAFDTDFDITQWVQVGAGIRYESTKTKSKVRAYRGGNYYNKAYRVEATFTAPFLEQLSLRLKQSTGFRTPSNDELYGSFLARKSGKDGGFKYKAVDSTKIVPETSLTREVALIWESDLLSANSTLYKADYKNLIAQATNRDVSKAVCLEGDCPKLGESSNGTPIAPGYYNINDVSIWGWQVDARMRLQELFNGESRHKILRVLSDFAQNVTVTASIGQSKKHSEKGIGSNFDYVGSYLLDTLQPLRAVLGIDYDRPDEKWGIGAKLIYSSPKNRDETVIRKVTGWDVKEDAKGSPFTSRHWATVDILGYYNPTKNFTLRLGVNNVFDYAYIPWEAYRQTSTGSDNQTRVEKSMNDREKNNIYRRFAAPGRNYYASLEWRF